MTTQGGARGDGFDNRADDLTAQSYRMCDDADGNRTIWVTSTLPRNAESHVPKQKKARYDFSEYWHACRSGWQQCKCYCWRRKFLLDLPLENDSSGGLLNNKNELDEESLYFNKGIDQSKIADLLEEIITSKPTIHDKHVVVKEVSNSKEVQEDEEENIIGSPNQVNREEREIPELTSEEEVRLMRLFQPPERYNPSSGSSYLQVDACHNIVKQSTSYKTLQYKEIKARVVANIIHHLHARCNAHPRTQRIPKGWFTSSECGIN